LSLIILLLISSPSAESFDRIYPPAAFSRFPQCGALFRKPGFPASRPDARHAGPPPECFAVLADARIKYN